MKFLYIRRNDSFTFRGDALRFILDVLGLFNPQPNLVTWLPKQSDSNG